MLRLLLARHGETDWNREGKYHGHTDIDLNSIGLEQAERLAQRLRSERVDAVYSSDLKRALHTAQHIAADMNTKVVSTKELREINLGYYEGKRFRGAEDEGRPLESAWEAGNIDFPIPGGETLYQLQARVAVFVSTLKERHGDGTVILVSHGGVLRVMICHLVGLELKYWWNLRLEGASLSEVDVYPNRNVLRLLNDRCHLADQDSVWA
jgi:broad specificity phosphatase PhoE